MGCLRPGLGRLPGLWAKVGCFGLGLGQGGLWGFWDKVVCFWPYPGGVLWHSGVLLAGLWKFGTTFGHRGVVLAPSWRFSADLGHGWRVFATLGWFCKALEHGEWVSVTLGVFLRPWSTVRRILPRMGAFGPRLGGFCHAWGFCEAPVLG